MSNKKVRIELRYDPIKDKDVIEFIDRYGSTRAGFIKNIIKIYKNKIESQNSKHMNNNLESAIRTKNGKEKQKNKKREKKQPFLGQAFSSKDFE